MHAPAQRRPWMGPRAIALERRLERPMLIAAALVAPALVLEQAHGQAYRTIATVLDWGIWLAFTAELLAMLAVVRRRRAWLAHNPMAVAIVVLTPPFLPALVQSLRVLRLLRLTRLLRLAPLFRLAFSARGLRYASFVTLLVVMAGAAVFESAEPSRRYLDALYWALGTMTTAGSGDVVATTDAAKLIGMVLMTVGIAYFAVITGSIAQRFVATGEQERVQAAASGAGEDVVSRLDAVALHARALNDEVEALRGAVAGKRHT